MRRRILGLMSLVVLAGGPPRADARTAAAEVDCAEYCSGKAVENCDDVTSNWCNAYIVGCLAGCGISHL